MQNSNFGLKFEFLRKKARDVRRIVFNFLARDVWQIRNGRYGVDRYGVYVWQIR
jgi:hypothetical protein